MKVLQVHNQYRVYGGEDAMLDLEANLLRQHGHEVERFTVSNKTVEKPSLRTGVETIWSHRSKRDLSRALSDVKPDLMHVHNTFPLLSPSVYWAAGSVPVVQTLHNYRLACVNASLLRDGHPCELCVGRKISWPGVRHRCYRGSAPASGAIAAMQAAHRAIGTFRNKVDAYITLTEFARSVMVRDGLPEELVHVKPNFVLDPMESLEDSPKRRDRITFVGRLSHEKGVDLLIDAWSRLRPSQTRLAIAGDGPERTELERRSRGLRGVEWLGWLDRGEVLHETLGSRFVVLPSKWYEGFPMVVVEALSTGTPVIGPAHGGFPEVISHGETGFLFKPGDPESLAEQLSAAANTTEERWRSMSEKARETYLARYTPETNYETLMEVYARASERAIKKSRRKGAVMRRHILRGFVLAQTALFMLENTETIKAVATWPKFSVTSYVMVSRMKKQGISPRTVLDVGANVGQFAVAAAKLWPESRIHSFEPVPECAEELKGNASKLRNVSVYPFALGDSEGEIEFHVNAHTHSSSALPLGEAHLEAFPQAREARRTNVKVTTLDKVFDDTDLEGPVLLKLDVQGYEPQALRGGEETLKRVDYVVLEASLKPMYEGEKLFMDINEMMEQMGFRFARPVGLLEAPETHEVLQMDALFVRR